MDRQTNRKRRVRSPAAAVQTHAVMVGEVGAVEASGRCDASRDNSSLARTSAGLLIPALARSVPRTLHPEDSDVGVVERLLKHGWLKPNEIFESPGDAVQKGVERLVTFKEIKRLDDNFDSVRVYVRADDEIDFTIYGGIEMNGPTSLAKFAKRIERSPIAARWMGWLLNNHMMIAGPTNFDYYMDNYYQPGHSANGKWEDSELDDAGKKVFLAKANKAYQQFKREHSWLYVDSKREPVSRRTGLAAIKRIDRKLCGIAEAMVENRDPHNDFDTNEPFFSFSWEKGSMISHCWDYIFRCYENGDFDGGESRDVCATSGTVATIRAKIARFESIFAPVQAFERYLLHGNRN